MICITINQESRRFALVDMLNAGRQCDLLEVRLDRFEKSPDLSEIFANKPKPIIMSCRRKQDGGYWEGSEEERLTLLRQCIVSKADYVEIELDVADSIRRFPPSQRVISYTNLAETPFDILEIYDEMKTKSPDVIKLTTLARTPEEAWPLVQIMAKPMIPTVVVGLGKPGVMLSVLGKKIGSPWTYAALEKGMEAFPGQPTISDLRDAYHYGDIQKSTRFIGVTGFGEREYYVVAAMNALFKQSGLPARCLPMGVGDVKLFRKVMEAVKLAGVIIDGPNQAAMLEIATERHTTAEQTKATDLLLYRGTNWTAYNTICQAAGHGISSAMRTKYGDHPLKGRMVMIVGINPLARAMAAEMIRRGGNVMVASYARKAGQEAAQALGCRYVLFEALYSSMHDVLVVCDEEKEPTAFHPGGPGIHAGYLRSGMAVMDMTAPIRPSYLLNEAKARGCLVVEPRQLLLDQLELQARLIVGKQVSREVLEKAIPVEE